MNKERTILVTGGGGYLGSVLVPMLLLCGYKVRVLDRFFWGKKVFGKHINHRSLRLIKSDVRNFPKKYLKNVYAVIDLAALSNDPIGELKPRATIEINFKGRERTARMAKEAGVKRYILASSCSVYGFQDGVLNEKSNTSPVTTYARSSRDAEKAVLAFGDKNFIVSVLRQGTLYGVSPRMRFDVVLNTITLSCFNKKEILVIGGDQWRPILHVEDSARAFIKTLEAEEKKVASQIFNVGSNMQNYQIKKLAKDISKALGPNIRLSIQNAQTDFRSYRVSFNKIRKILRFKTERSPEETAKEIYFKLAKKELTDSKQTKTIDWYKHLLLRNKKLLD